MTTARERVNRIVKPVLGRLTPWDQRVAIVSVLLLFTALAELTEEIVEAGTAPAIDREISDAMSELRSEHLTDAVRLVTSAANTWAVQIVAVVAVAGALRKGGAGLAVAVLGSIVATTTVVLVMKGVIGRERPLPPIGLDDHASAAYPSGHSAHSIGTWGRSSG